ncbi:MAG: HAD family hydrolase [Gammaproteobacteria bacterium]
MSIVDIPYAAPKIILFDWHATLVDTHDAMYHAIDDVLPMLHELDVIDRMVKTEDSKTLEDAKLVKYVLENKRLHPKLKAARKVSRTDIFQVLFGEDEQAKKIVHEAFDNAYRNYFGDVHPFEEGVEKMLEDLHELNLKVGALTNRNREFMMHEVSVVSEKGWEHFFHTIVCGDDVANRKPAPDQILQALRELNEEPSLNCWYIGDSTTDITAAKEAGVTGIYYNGAGWSRDWLDKIFPGTVAYPHRPDVVVDDFKQLMHLVRLEKFAVSE